LTLSKIDDIIKKKGGEYMNNLKAKKKENTPKIPLSFRLKYMFSGYKKQLLINTLSKKAPIFILAIFIISVVVYIFLNPIDKIKIRYFITRDCTIEVISDITPHNSKVSGSYENRSKVLIEGDWIESDGKYYNLIDGEWYRYYKDIYGKWQKEKYSIDISSSMGAKLLDKNNYVRDKKNPFVWILKEDAYEETFTMSNVRIERVYGSIAIVGIESRNGYNAEVSLCFKGFGTTDIEFPWDD
jgi:hypothetical protein